MEFLTQHNLTGLAIGLGTFLIIGIFHPFVIKGEYYFGVRIWWLFLLSGIGAIAASLWGIGELFEQRKRVEKGWFPRNPKRKS